jgi:hypothetical protein
MKKTTLILLLALLFLLSGCESQPVSTYTAEHNGVSYVIDRQAGEISDGTHVYQFEADDPQQTTIVYPNGSVYLYVSVGSIKNSSWSADYDETAYVSGDVLIELLADAPAAKNYLTAFFIAFAGVFTFISPKSAWFWGSLLGDEKKEPSPTALLVSRIGGGVIIVMAIGYLVF